MDTPITPTDPVFDARAALDAFDAEKLPATVDRIHRRNALVQAWRRAQEAESHSAAAEQESHAAAQ